jgi:hypothetical protein
MDAFETATATASQRDLLRLQQEILAEATQDEAALGADTSPEAAALRDAIKSTRSSVSGDLANIDSARANLGKVSGQTADSSASSAKPITDIKGFARDLDATVGAFQGALQRNDTSPCCASKSADQADQRKRANVRPRRMCGRQTCSSGVRRDTSKLSTRVQSRASAVTVRTARAAPPQASSMRRPCWVRAIAQQSGHPRSASVLMIASAGMPSQRSCQARPLRRQRSRDQRSASPPHARQRADDAR